MCCLLASGACSDVYHCSALGNVLAVLREMEAFQKATGRSAFRSPASCDMFGGKSVSGGVFMARDFQLVTGDVFQDIR